MNGGQDKLGGYKCIPGMSYQVAWLIKFCLFGEVLDYN